MPPAANERIRLSAPFISLPSYPFVPLSLKNHDSSTEAEVLRGRFSNFLPYHQRRRGCGRWNVEHMQRLSGRNKLKIVYQAPVALHGLRPHARTSGDEILFAYLREKPLQRFHKSRLGK